MVFLSVKKKILNLLTKSIKVTNIYILRVVKSSKQTKATQSKGYKLYRTTVTLKLVLWLARKQNNETQIYFYSTYNRIFIWLKWIQAKQPKREIKWLCMKSLLEWSSFFVAFWEFTRWHGQGKSVLIMLWC